MSTTLEWYCLPYQYFVNTAHVEMILVVKLRVTSLATRNVVINLSGSCVVVVTCPSLEGFCKCGTFVLPVSL
jgi:hypothetical protein